jgi:hypothetical protein
MSDQSRWIITKGGGDTPTKKSGRVGPGAVRKARETREKQLQRDLAKARRERLQQAVAGEFGVRAPGGAGRVGPRRHQRPASPPDEQAARE